MIEKNTLEDLYCKEKRSVAEIADKLNVSYPKAVYWVKKHGIPTRSRSDSMYVKLNRTGDPFSPKQKLTAAEQELFFWGLALYWAEGGRKARYTVQVGNLDYRLLRLFMEFLRVIVCFDESRIRVDVRVFEKFDLSRAGKFWARQLAIAPNRVFVYKHTDKRSQIKKQWSKYGIAAICASNTKFKVGLDQQLQENVERLIRYWAKTPRDFLRLAPGRGKALETTFTYG